MGTETVILGYIIAFIVGVLITREIFSIGKITRTMEAQTKLWTEIAKIQGVDQNVIAKILEGAKGKELFPDSNNEK